MRQLLRRKDAGYNKMSTPTSLWLDLKLFMSSNIWVTVLTRLERIINCSTNILSQNQSISTKRNALETCGLVGDWRRLALSCTYPIRLLPVDSDEA